MTQTDIREVPVVILCGGLGTRLREATEKLPKPLIDIGGKPILWHIMKTYSAYGTRRFVLCLGYKSDLIKRYFLDYREHASDFTMNLTADGDIKFHSSAVAEDWEITFVETGLTTATAGRVSRVADFLDADRFFLTYGDGLGNVDVAALWGHHLDAGRMATVTAVHPSSRYGEMQVDEQDALVVEFNEKPTLATGWVNGGFFVFERDVLGRYITDDPAVMLEHAPLQQLARDRELTLYRHEGFWMGMDTFRDWTELNTRWDRGDAPWRVWAD